MRGLCVWVIWDIACLRGLHVMYSISHALSHQFYFICHSLSCFDGTIHWYCLMGSVRACLSGTHTTLSYCLSNAFKLSEIWSSLRSSIITLGGGYKGKKKSCSGSKSDFKYFCNLFFLLISRFIFIFHCVNDGDTLSITLVVVWKSKGWTLRLIENKDTSLFLLSFLNCLPTFIIVLNTRSTFIKSSTLIYFQMASSECGLTQWGRLLSEKMWCSGWCIYFYLCIPYWLYGCVIALQKRTVRC